MHLHPSTIHAAQWQGFFSSAQQLPKHLQFLIQTRLASTTATPVEAEFQAHSNNPFPFPVQPHPTPHQIFHLPQGASQADIKARYYDLVRHHHPDSRHSQVLNPSERHARFQSITSAYEILQRGSMRTYPGQSNFDPYLHELDKRKRAYYATHNRRAEYSKSKFKDEPVTPEMLLKEKMILLFGILTLAAGLYPRMFLGPLYVEKTHHEAVTNLSQARKEAREHGEARRDKVKEHVKKYKKKQEDTACSEGRCDKPGGQAGPTPPGSHPGLSP